MQKYDPRVYQLVLGKVIAALRSKRGLSQDAFAVKVGISQPTLSRIERGKSMPDALEQRRIADVLGLSLDQLNAYVDDAYARTRRAAEGAAGKGQGGSPLGTVLKVAGFVGLAGLVAFAVAAIINEIDKDE